jgi:hypothetical protein
MRNIYEVPGGNFHGIALKFVSLSFTWSQNYYLNRYTMSIPTTHDVEGQMVVQDNRARRPRCFSGCRHSHASALSEVALLLRFKNCASLSDRAGQCCYLCLQGRKIGQYAVQVPCMRPQWSQQAVPTQAWPGRPGFSAFLIR